jgi:hypothetical protein
MNLINRRRLAHSNFHSLFKTAPKNPSHKIPAARNSFLPALFLILMWESGMVSTTSVYAQDDYEIQVYGAETVESHRTMVELHSNFAIQGSKEVVDGVLPTERAWHETIEITRGFNSWFETGFYIFTSIQPGRGWDWVGDHIRPRFRIPASWNWPVGISISNEIGYQRPIYSANTWTWEIRPIIDRIQGRWYFAFNPTLERALHSKDGKNQFEFSPNLKIAYSFTRQITGGFEYYGSLGPVTGFDPLSEQQQQIVPAIDLHLSPNWEFNFGVGIGMTQSTDHLILKMIVGYRF